MSVSPPYSGPGPAGGWSPAAGVRARQGRSPEALDTRKVPWGWLEWVILSQFLLPVLLFLPGASVVRLFVRIGVFAIPLLALVWLVGRAPRNGARPFPAVPWLLVACGWLVLSIGNPGTNSLMSGLAQATLYLAILCPAFWISAALSSPRQIPRLMALLLLCNAASALVGIGQFYRPETFNPPAMAILNEETASGLMYRTADGRTIFRPCGLGDSPGAASVAGLWAAILGMAWVLKSSNLVRRLICLGLAMVGVAIIYFTMVRSLLLLTVGGLGVLFMVLLLQRDVRKAALLGCLGALVLAASMGWAMRSGGTAVLDKFGTLLEKDIVTTYQENRGHYLAYTLDHYLWKYPLGAGMGRWGMMYYYFGQKGLPWNHPRGPIWAEIQWTGWVIDGGIVLLVAYLGAITVALGSTLRIALTSSDRDLAFWAAVILSVCMTIAVQTIAAVPFVSAKGILFWGLVTAIHAADAQARQQGRRRGRTVGPRRPAWAANHLG